MSHEEEEEIANALKDELIKQEQDDRMETDVEDNVPEVEETVPDVEKNERNVEENVRHEEDKIQDVEDVAMTGI